MKRIKLCHLVDGSTFNILLYNSIKYSDRSVFEYIVITLQPEGKLQEQMAELGVRSFSVNYSSKWQILSTIWRLFRFFRREKIDIVQTHLLASSLLGLSAARLARVPVTIFTGHHSHEVPLYNRKLLTYIDGLCGRLLSKYTIAPSNDMKNILIRCQKVPARKIEVIPHGFDLSSLRNAAKMGNDIKKELNIEDKIIFGAVGRLFWVKDFENLINTFAEVAKQRNDIVLLIVGEGGEKEKLQNLVESYQLKAKIIFTGKRNDIAAVMNSFDVFVHTALAESFGMVFIEAFALGKPIISTKVGVAPDIVEDGVNGFLVREKNQKELSSAMLKMLDVKSKWQEMGERARLIAENFAVQKTQAQCDDFYRKAWHKENINKI